MQNPLFNAKIHDYAQLVLQIITNPAIFSMKKSVLYKSSLWAILVKNAKEVAHPFTRSKTGLNAG
jgi:hypothetical protein